MTQSRIWQQCMEAKAVIQDVIGAQSPRIGVILGSGLGGFGAHIDVAHRIEYDRIPHFKPCGVEGHQGNLIVGHVSGKPVLCQQGRYHYYEGHTMADVVFPVRVMAALGVEIILVSNAAGGINPNFGVGDIMLINDHINFFGTNPLRGENVGALGPRFPDMTQAYDTELRDLMRSIAQQRGITLREGVYLGTSGPSYETPAEITMFATLGADAVGMSTVPEVIAAHHAGLRVVGLSCVSNAAAGLSDQKLDHEDVQHMANQVGATFESLVTGWIEAL